MVKIALSRTNLWQRVLSRSGKLFGLLVPRFVGV